MAVKRCQADAAVVERRDRVGAQRDHPLQVGQGLGVTAQAHQHRAAVVQGDEMARIDRQGRRIGDEGRVGATLLELHARAGDVGFDVVGLGLDHPHQQVVALAQGSLAQQVERLPEHLRHAGVLRHCACLSHEIRLPDHPIRRRCGISLAARYSDNLTPAHPGEGRDPGQQAPNVQQAAATAPS